MKKAILIAALMALAGCGTPETEVMGDIWTWKDPRNGCEYLRSSYGGMTPRMGPDGNQICTPPPEQQD